MLVLKANHETRGFGFSFLNPVHVCGRRDISPLRNPCFSLSDFVSVVRPAQFLLSYNRNLISGFWVDFVNVFVFRRSGSAVTSAAKSGPY